MKSYKRLFCCYESNNHSVSCFFFLIWPADGAQLSVSVCQLSYSKWEGFTKSQHRKYGGLTKQASHIFVLA